MYERIIMYTVSNVWFICFKTFESFLCVIGSRLASAFKLEHTFFQVNILSDRINIVFPNLYLSSLISYFEHVNVLNNRSFQKFFVDVDCKFTNLDLV